MKRATLPIFLLEIVLLASLSVPGAFAQAANRNGKPLPQSGKSAKPSPQATNEREFEKDDAPRRRMEWFYHQRAYPNAKIPAGARLRAMRQLEALRAREAAARGGHAQPAAANWTLVGPQPLNGFWGVNSGRVAAAVVDPTNSNVVYMGAAQGGVWKTTDGGVNWTPLTDTQPSLAVGSIALDPQNHNTVYVGTGEENNSGDSYYGAGILKSTDGGMTWTQISGPFGGGSNGGARIGGIAVHPSNSPIVLAAVGCCNPALTSGVFRSADGGSTWAQTLNVSNNQVYNVIFDPTNGNNVYASVDGNGVYKSTDAGLTWAADNGSGSTSLPTAGTGRVALAIAPSSTTTLYAAVTNNSTNGIVGLYKTTDGGATWSVTNAPNYCEGQCWYDNVIAVAPNNPNVVFAGGAFQTPLIRSLDGGVTWANSFNGLHPDMHALVFTADSSKIYAGDDGGIWSSTDITNTTMTWITQNATLATIQYYSGPSINPSNVNNGFAGTQDNAAERYTGSLAWQSIDCGDGGQTAIDFTTPTTVYTNCIQISLDKSTDGGNTFSSVLNGINTSDRSQWVPPLTMDPNTSTTLYYGTQFVYQSTNAAELWTAISPDLTAGGALTSIAVAPSDSNTVYAGSSDSKVQVTTNAGAGTGAVWTDRSAGLPTLFVTKIAADPGTSTTAYVTFSGFNNSHVLKTTNGGVTWTDISGDLPNIPVNDIVVEPSLANTLYIATDLGMFYTSTGGSHWATLGSGLPNVAVYGLAVHRSSHTLWAATHGRSMWSLNLSSVLPILTITSLSPPSVPVGNPAFTLTVNGVAFDNTSVVKWNGTNVVTTFVSSAQVTAAVPAADVANGGTAQVTVFNSSTNQTSNAATFSTTNPLPSLVSMSPTSTTAGSNAITLTLNGSNFLASSTALWNNVARSTTFVNGGQLTAAVPASDLTTAGTASVTVSNPAPGGGTSSALTFTINNPVPGTTSLTPNSTTLGHAALSLTVNGSSFLTTSIVKWNGSSRTTTFVNSTQVKAAISATDVATAGTIPVTVSNPAPGGGTSNSQTFTINNPKPTIKTLSPTSAIAGGAAFTLTVNGTNFLSTSVVQWNGVSLSTTFVSKIQLKASVPASDVATTGNQKVTVVNPAPGGGASAAKTFVVNNPVPSIASLNPPSIKAGSAAFTLTVNGSNFVPKSVVKWKTSSLVTTFVSANQITALVPATDVKTAGSVPVTVVNPAPGGGTSAPKTFTITP